MDFRPALAMIESASRILLTSHVRPDGDAIGSMAALERVIRLHKQKRGQSFSTQMLLLSEPAGNYRFLLTQQAWVLGETLSQAAIDAGRLDEFDLIVVADTSAVRQLPGVDKYLLGRPEGVLVLDHHLSQDQIGTCRLIQTAACATGEIVYDLCRAASWAVDAEAAQALFVAISTDTGWFRFENSSVRSYAMAAELVAAGAQPQVIYHQLFETFPPARLKLTALAMQSVELHYDDRLALMHITKAMLAQSGAKRGHIENIVNECAQIGALLVWVLLVEQEDGSTRCSFRSRSTVDVNEVARRFGGGGHARAAGATLSVGMEEARREVLAAVGSVIQ